MTINVLTEYLKNNLTFTRKDLKTILINSDATLSDSSLTRLLNKLIKQGLVVKKDNKYNIIKYGKPYYKFEMSNKLKEITNLIDSYYPDINFIVWEYSQLNDFVNHLIGKNTFFIEVEKDYLDIIFDLLNENYSKVLYNPTFDLFSLYCNDEPIIIRRLITRSPVNDFNHFQPSIEKLLVDLVHDSFTSKLISKSELQLMFDEVYKNYLIDHNIIKNYALRRNALDKINMFLVNKEEA